MIVIAIECDQCGTRSHAEKNTHGRISLMRLRAAKCGWDVSSIPSVPRRDSKDYCPSCVRSRGKTEGA